VIVTGAFNERKPVMNVYLQFFFIGLVAFIITAGFLTYFGNGVGEYHNMSHNGDQRAAQRRLARLKLNGWLFVILMPALFMAAFLWGSKTAMQRVADQGSFSVGSKAYTVKAN
jgi:hypothetical protein